MPIEWHYSHPTTPAGPGFDNVIPNAVQIRAEHGLSARAELGEADGISIVFDDPAGAYDFKGLHRVFAVETDAIDPDDTLIWNGYVGLQDIDRGEDNSFFPVDEGCRWDLALEETSSIIGFRVITDDDGDRPAESAGERLAWLLGSDYLSTVNDNGLIDWDRLDAVAMDENDYRTRRPTDVIADIANEANVNYWAFYDPTAGPDERITLAVFHFDSSALYTSDLRISNYAEDIDFDPDDPDAQTTFAPEPQPGAKLSRDPGRIAAGAVIPYPGGFRYDYDYATSDEFGFRDQVAPTTSVKTAAKADALLARYLEDFDEQDERITNVRITVPKTLVNKVKHGHRIQARFRHLVGHRDWGLYRVLWKALGHPENESQAVYEIDLELSPQRTAPSDLYLLSFMPLRAGNAEDGTVVPHGRASCISVANLTDWTWLGAASAREGGNYSMFAASRAGAATDEPMFNVWQGVGGGPRPNIYNLQIAGATGPPALLGHSNYNGGTFVSPTVSVPGDGWLFMLLSSSSGATPGDAGGGYAFVPVTSGIVEIDQQYAPPTFAPRSWLGYLPVAAGPHSLALTYSGSNPLAGDPGWGCLLVFVPGAALSIVDYVLQSSAVADTCWEWGVAP